jgi:EF hand
MKKMMLCSLGLIAALATSSAFATEPPAPAPDAAHKGSKMFEENDSNKDGVISKDEWRARGDKMFSDTDANNDGKLSKEEIKAHHDKKRAEWKDRREDRKEKMGEMKEKMNQRPDDKTAPASTEAH